MLLQGAPTLTAAKAGELRQIERRVKIKDVERIFFTTERLLGRLDLSALCL
jgi:hypothetical protein